MLFKMIGEAGGCRNSEIEDEVLDVKGVKTVSTRQLRRVFAVSSQVLGPNGFHSDKLECRGFATICRAGAGEVGLVGNSVANLAPRSRNWPRVTDQIVDGAGTVGLNGEEDVGSRDGESRAPPWRLKAGRPKLWIAGDEVPRPENTTQPTGCSSTRRMRSLEAAAGGQEADRGEEGGDLREGRRKGKVAESGDSSREEITLQVGVAEKELSIDSWGFGLGFL